ncbi:MAG: GldG family protein [Cyclobacteriaceae bacterium]|nr:GldG family protein [Cyclobacteriaceae bacterium HetDA_MAG_MS6]
MKKTNIVFQLLIVAAIILVFNLISDQLYFRIDFTEDKRYTLSDATKDVLENLEEVITVKAYFTEELPAQLAYVRNDLRDQLVEYEDRSGGNLVFEFINPNATDELKNEAMQNGVVPVSINVVENDQRQQLQAFMGLVFKSGEKTEVIPLIQPGAAMEYDLTTAVKKISINDKPKVGFLQGHGEPSLSAMPQLLEQLSVLYDVEPVSLPDTATIPSYYRSIVWVSPTDTIDTRNFAKVDRYLDGGGNLFLAYSNVQGDLQTSSLTTAPDIGMASWVAQKGLQMGRNFVIDANCASITVQQRSGFFTINSQVEFPYFPRISNFGDHPVAQGLEGMLLPFVNNLAILGQDSSLSIKPIVLSSEVSGIAPAPVYVDIQKKWSQRDFTQPEQILSASIEGIGAGDGNMVLIANSTFMINGEGQQQQQLSPDNVNFASNAVDWLSDDTGLIDLRTKGITSRPLDQVEDSTKGLLKYGNVFAPIFLILVYAFIRRQASMRKRQRWSQGNYN